jgi:hypothetical protein
MALRENGGKYSPAITGSAVMRPTEWIVSIISEAGVIFPRVPKKSFVASETE